LCKYRLAASLSVLTQTYFHSSPSMLYFIRETNTDILIFGKQRLIGMHQCQLTGHQSDWFQSTHWIVVVRSDQDLVRLGVIRLDWVPLRMNHLGSIGTRRPVVTGTGAYLTLKSFQNKTHVSFEDIEMLVLMSFVFLMQILNLLKKPVSMKLMLI